MRKLELNIGDKAPLFIGESTKGEISLKDYKNKHTILYFYPKDMTPGCTVEANEFSALYDDFKLLDVEIIGISRDSVASHHKFCNKENIPYPLISDIGGEICKSYKILKDKINFGKKYLAIERSTFLIDKDLKIKEVWRRVKVKDHAQKVYNRVAIINELEEALK